MGLAVVYSRAGVGVDAPEVKVEVHLGGGLPRMSMVGLPETAVREAKDRVKAALLNAKFKFPQVHITIALSPADLPKEGGRFAISSLTTYCAEVISITHLDRVWEIFKTTDEAVAALSQG